MKRYGEYDIELIPTYNALVRRECLKLADAAQKGNLSDLVDGVYGLLKYFVQTIKKDDVIVPPEQYEDLLLRMGNTESIPLYEDIVSLIGEDEAISTLVEGVLLSDTDRVKKKMAAINQATETSSDTL